MYFHCSLECANVISTIHPGVHAEAMATVIPLQSHNVPKVNAKVSSNPLGS